MAINRLSKEAERNITEALEKVAEMVADGSHPDEAIVKVASERSLPAGHVNLMVNAFNTGRAETQRKIGGDIFEKAAEFDLADAENILGKMFPKSVKTASQIHTETAVSEEYSAPPTWYKRHVKAAAAKLELPPLVTKAGKAITGVEPLPTDPVEAMKKAHCRMLDAARELDNQRGVASAAHDKLVGSITKLGEYFRKTDCEPFLGVKGNMTRIFGKKAEALFSILEKRNRSLTKQAGSGKEFFSLVEFSKQPYSLVKECLENAEDYLKKQASFEEFQKKASALSEETLLPFVVPQDQATSLGVLGSFEKKSNLGALAAGYILSPAAGATAAGKELAMSTSVPSTADARLSWAKRTSDPIQAATLRNIEAQSMLTDLMANDDVISTYDPDTVLDHYNQISELAPRASTQESLVRSILRKRLASGNNVDPYEIDQLLSIESKLKDRDTDSSVQRKVEGSPTLGVI